MPNNTPITIVGNLGADPELRYTSSGLAAASFNVAVAHRKYDRQANEWQDAGTTWYRVNAWRNLAENAANSLTRGTRVVVTGSLASRAWEDREGNKRESWEITADALGPDLSYATARVMRSRRDDMPAPDGDPWADSGEPAEPAEPASEPDNGESKPARTGRRASGSKAP
jgi:single-strand DNA-binding protein